MITIVAPPSTTVKKKYNRSKSIQFRVQSILTPDLHKKITDISLKTGKSESSIILHALSKFDLDNYLKLHSK